MRTPSRLRDFGIAKVLDFLERDPDRNLPRLMEWVDQYAGKKLPPAYRDLFQQVMHDPDNNWHRLIRSMYTDIDSRVLKKIFENFVIHGRLLEWPELQAAGRLTQDKAPWSVIIDPSFPCTMDCSGCGASIFGVRPVMEFDSMDEVLERRKAQGCHLFIISGGDPLSMEEEAIALCNKHGDCVFAAFTPPQSITEKLCDDLLRVGNLFPAIRVDEDAADAARAMGLLRARKLPFGVACGCTAENADYVATKPYYDLVIAAGAKFCWFFACPAYGPAALPSPEQLAAIHRRVQQFRRTEPLLTLDFWDGPAISEAVPQGGKA